MDSPEDPARHVTKDLANIIVPPKDAASKRTVQFTEFVDEDDVNENSEEEKE